MTFFTENSEAFVFFLSQNSLVNGSDLPLIYILFSMRCYNSVSEEQDKIRIIVLWVISANEHIYYLMNVV